MQGSQITNAAAAAAAKSLQSCPTLCDPRDGSPPGFAIPGILQARMMLNNFYYTLQIYVYLTCSECLSCVNQVLCCLPGHNEICWLPTKILFLPSHFSLNHMTGRIALLPEQEQILIRFKIFNFMTTVFWHSCCCSCSVAKSCPTLCNLMECSMPGFPVLHYFLEFAQTHVHLAYGAIQPSHPLSYRSL